MRKQILIGVVLTLALAGFYGAYRLVSFTAAVVGELDRSRQLTAIAPRAQATLVMDRHGRPAFSFYSEQRTDVPIDRVSRHMRDAIVAVEDRRFYSHHGLDPVRIAKAAMAQRARRPHSRGRQHHHAAARAGGAALAGADVRAQDPRGDDRAAARGALLEGGDPAGVPEYRLLRRGLLRRRGRIPRLLRQVRRRPRRRRSRAAGGARPHRPRPMLRPSLPIVRAAAAISCSADACSRGVFRAATSPALARFRCRAARPVRRPCAHRR